MGVLGFFRLIKEAREFKTHDHITISGSGVASTTSAHYMNSPKARQAAKGIAEMFNIEIKKD